MVMLNLVKVCCLLTLKCTGLMSSLTLSRQLDVLNVTFLPAVGANLTLCTSSPQRQVGKDRREGVLYYYAGRQERVKKDAVLSRFSKNVSTENKVRVCNGLVQRTGSLSLWHVEQRG